MIVDSSAIIAILRQEPDAELYARALSDAPGSRMSAATFLEAAIVADRAGNPLVSRRFDDICRDAALVVVPFTEEHARIAREAYRDFGRGSGHPANLNLGDCFAYALAKAADEPLLYKGADFGHTDVRSVLP